MADLKPVSDDISTTPSMKGEAPVMVDEKNIASRPAPRRQVSEWEAIQIAAAGDNDSIDREIAEVEADLQKMNIKSTWYKPQLKMKDPRHFTWLLVGFASMGGLLSGVDQSLISGANLYMPGCKLPFFLRVSTLTDKNHSAQPRYQTGLPNLLGCSTWCCRRSSDAWPS